MAITKITAPSSIPATVADYQAQNSHLMAFINQINSQAFILSDPNGTVAPTIKQGAYISHGGSLYIVDTADATISGTPSDGTVYVRVSGTDTLTAEYITDISSYAWNSAYNAMISGSYTLLPYMLIKSGTSWTKYRFEQHKQSFGAIKVTSLDTGQGANELYAMNQNLRTIDSPEFANYKTATYTTAVDLNTIITNGHYYVAHGGANNPSATYCSLHVSGDSDVKSQTLIDTAGKIWWRGGRLIGSGSDIWSAWKTIDQSLDTTSSPTFANITIAQKINGYTPTAVLTHGVLSSFVSPSTIPSGLTFDGTNLISCDANTGMIYVHNGVSSSILSSFVSPSTYPSGLTFDGTNLISCDNGTDMIYVHNGISASILSSFASPSQLPRGLTFDGTNLISCDNNTDMIYVHNGISATIISSFASPSTWPTDLTFDGTNLISCDEDSDRIYVHNGISPAIISSFVSPSDLPSGLTFDGTNLISCDSLSDRIYIHKNELKLIK